jgi:hypothetical protein
MISAHYHERSDDGRSLDAKVLCDSYAADGDIPGDYGNEGILPEAGAASQNDRLRIHYCENSPLGGLTSVGIGDPHLFREDQLFFGTIWPSENWIEN